MSPLRSNVNPPGVLAQPGPACSSNRSDPNAGLWRMTTPWEKDDEGSDRGEFALLDPHLASLRAFSIAWRRAAVIREPAAHAHFRHAEGAAGDSALDPHWRSTERQGSSLKR